MKNLRIEVLKLLKMNESLSPDEVHAHARLLIDDEVSVKDFVKMYFDAKMKKIKCESDMNRIWPEKKGY